MARQRIGAAVGTQTMPGTRVPQGLERSTEGRPSGLARIFAVPDGEPVDARLAHIRQLTPGERLWFEQGVRVGRSRPRALRAPRRREARRPRGGPPDAPAPLLGEGGVRPRGGAARPRRGRDGDRALRRGGAAPGRGPGARPSCSPGPRGSAPSRRCRTTDALDHAEPLGDDVERVTDAGELAGGAVGRARPRRASRRRSRRRSPGACSGRSTRRGCAAPAAAPATWPTTTPPELPACPRCGTPDTWEARQPAAFRAWLQAIDDLPDPDRPGRPRPSALRGAPAPGPGRRRVDAVPDPPGRARRRGAAQRRRARAARDDRARGHLGAPALGAALYRRQHAAGAPGLTPAEWRRIWAAYRARRPARPA